MIHHLLNFREPELSDASAVRRCTLHSLQSDLSFANIYLLKHKYGTQILFHMEHLIRYFSGNGRLRGYSFPTGGKAESIDRCLQDIEKDAAHAGVPLHYCLLTEDQAQYLQKIYGDAADIKCDSGDADYLYRRETLATLPGSKFHKKRAHISKFEKTRSGIRCEALRSHNRHHALEVAERWLESQGTSPSLLHEHRAIEHALTHADELSLAGLLVYAHGKPIAMTIVSYLNEMVADIHYEKCIPEYRDAYSFINRELAASLPVEWINREEDLNIPGLRQAKLSYYPSLILKKFTATIHVN